jgi:hypothetical protein
LVGPTRAGSSRAAASFGASAPTLAAAKRHRTRVERNSRRGRSMATWHYEQRRSPRVTVNAAGRLVLISQGLRIKDSIACRVIDISKGGALIQASSAVGDDHFYLEVDDDPGKLQLCAVVRRTGNRIGVQFIS